VTAQLWVCVVVVILLVATTILLAILAKRSNVTYADIPKLWRRFAKAWREGKTAAERFLLVLLVASALWRGGAWASVAGMAGATGVIGGAVCGWEVAEVFAGIRGILCDLYGAVRGQQLKVPCGPASAPPTG
jgi:hypothetical protein